MKMAGILIAVIIGLLEILLSVAAFLPSNYTVKRSQIIYAPVDSVFFVLVDLTRRYQWDPWIEREPGTTIEVGGSRQGVGAYYYWQGKQIGEGRLTIETIDENHRIDSRLEYDKPKSAKTKEIWLLKDLGGSTEVTWNLRGRLKYPVERYLGLMMDTSIGPDFEKGLSNLKQLIER